ncbi:MAG: chordopoxvirus fusion protein, partial [bacterium]
TVGFVLENEAYRFLPALLKQEFGLEVQGKLMRKFVTDKKGEQIEVNIIGEAVRNGNHFVIIGESKSQLSKNKIAEFFNKKLKRLEGVFAGELFPILITHMISQPDVADFALQQGVKRVYYSYEFSS